MYRVLFYAVRELDQDGSRREQFFHRSDEVARGRFGVLADREVIVVWLFAAVLRGHGTSACIHGSPSSTSKLFRPMMFRAYSLRTKRYGLTAR